MAKYINNRNNGQQVNKLASTVYDVGDFLIFNGLGQVVRATGGVAVVGVGNEAISSIDSDFTVTRPMNLSESVPNDELEIPVSIGTLTAAMVGSKFDVDPAAPGSIDVSGAGTDILVTGFVNASTAIGKIVQ